MIVLPLLVRLTMARRLINPSLGLSAREQRDVQREAWRRARARSKGYMDGLGELVLAGIVAGSILLGVLVSFWLSVATCVGLAGIFLCVWSSRVHRREFAMCVFSELRRRGHEVCPDCGYPLVTSSATCSECGAKAWSV